VVVRSSGLHLAPAALFRIDTDTAFNPSTATRAPRDRERVVSALKSHTVGTYLGLAVAWLPRP
jgi:hypothetical protein